MDPTYFSEANKRDGSKVREKARDLEVLWLCFWCSSVLFYLYFQHWDATYWQFMGALSPFLPPGTSSSLHPFFPDAHWAACGARLWNFEAGAAAEWTDRQTMCRFWLGLSSSVMEEDSSAFASLPSPLTPLEGTLFKSSHPGGQTHCWCKASPTHTHPLAHADTQHVRLVCLLTVDMGYQCPIPPAVMGQWLAGKWLLCLHGRLIGAYVVLDLELPELHKLRWIVRPIKVALRTPLDSVFSTWTEEGRTCTTTREL